jgi:hypothetical protein
MEADDGDGSAVTLIEVRMLFPTLKARSNVSVGLFSLTLILNINGRPRLLGSSRGIAPSTVSYASRTLHSPENDAISASDKEVMIVTTRKTRKTLRKQTEVIVSSKRRFQWLEWHFGCCWLWKCCLCGSRMALIVFVWFVCRSVYETAILLLLELKTATVLPNV